MPAGARTYASRAATRLAPGHRGRRLAGRVLGTGPLVVPEGLGAGLRLCGVPVTHVQAYGLIRGTLEPSVQEALRRHVAPGATVYDAGANVGFFSLLAARLAGSAGRVVAFEPAPETARVLRRNVRLNGDPPIEIREAAVADRTGRARFLQVEERSWSHLEERGRHPRTEAVVEVDVVAIDELEGVPPPDVVKLDVEGSEVEALRGMARTLSEHRPVVICELHSTRAEVAAAAERHGYALHDLDDEAHVLLVPAER